MKTTKELYAFYKETLLPNLGRLELKRKKIINKFAVISAIAILLLALLFYIKAHGIIITLCFFAWIGSYFLITEDYVSEFKTMIVQRIVSFVDENLKYVKDGFIPATTFMACDIFKRRPDRYRGDDFVSGRIGSTEVAFSEIHAEYRSGSGRHSNWDPIFDGLFFVADFNKNFTGKTVVLPDKAEKMFGHIGTLMQSWNKGRGELIKLEDPEFENLFVVYGSDQVGSRYILSPSLMKRIVDFKIKTKKAICLSFVGSRIFVAVSYKKELFEPRVFQTLLEFAPIQEYFEDLQLIIGIVEDLNLNTRIWSKR